MSRLNLQRHPSMWEWAQTLLLCANLVWTVACLGGYRAHTLVVTVVLTAALLGVHGAALWAAARETAPQPPLHRAGWVLLPFLLYAAANVLWVSPVPWLGWFDWLGWAQAFVVFWVTLNAVRSRVAVACVWGTLFSLGAANVVLGCYQCFVQPDWLMLHRLQVEQFAGRASGTFGIPNSLGGFLILQLPVAFALAFRRGASPVARVFFGWLAAVLLVGLAVTISRGAWLAFAVAMIVWPVLRNERPLGQRLRWAAAVAVAAVAIIWVAYAQSARVNDRFDQLVRDVGERSRPVLWRAAWRIFTAHPVVGTGAGSFDLAFESQRPESFDRTPRWAHNDYLNTLSDYGAAGFLLLAGGVIASAILARTGRPTVMRSRRGPWVDPVVVQATRIGLLAFALQLTVDSHLKIAGLALTAAVVGALALRGTTYDGVDELVDPGASARPRRWIAGACVAGAAVLVVAAVSRYHGEALRDGARERIDGLDDVPPASDRFRSAITTAEADLRRAVALAPDNAQAWADLAYALAQRSRAEPADVAKSGRTAEDAAAHALALAPAVPEFWIRRGVARDMQGRWPEAGADFTHALSLAPRKGLSWFHYAYHLTLHPLGHDMAPAVLATGLRLDPGNRAGLRLRQHLATGTAGP